MSAAAKKQTGARRDYDRRKKRAPIRKVGRPIWRQPMLLGVVVLLLG
jgi:cell division protein FtsQ